MSFGVSVAFWMLVPSLVPALGQVDRRPGRMEGDALSGENPAGVRGRSLQRSPGPWDNDVFVYEVDPSGQVKHTATFERAGVPTLARLRDGRLGVEGAVAQAAIVGDDQLAGNSAQPVGQRTALVVVVEPPLVLHYSSSDG
jgi:hypothetical protein